MLTQTDQSSFISVVFTYNQPDNTSIIYWDKLDTLTAEVIIKDKNFENSIYKYKYFIPNKAAIQLQTKLSKLQNVRLGELEEYRLSLSNTDSMKTNLVWSKPQESTELLVIREHLETLVHLKYNVAQAFYYNSIKLFEKDKDIAVETISSGINNLGTLYRNEKIRDSTGMKLVLAQSEKEKGNIERAFHLLRGVLHSRMILYSEKFQLNEVPEY